MTQQPLLFERGGPVARLTLNRPEVGNAIDLPLARALMAASIACDEDDTIRCVLLSGAGKLFCAGGDVAAFAAAGEQVPQLLKELTANLHMAISRFARMNKPLVTAINGAAAGAGFGLAILGDIVLAARSAKLVTAYGGIGLSPDGGATWLLPRLVGLRRAQELALTDRRLTADEALALGLVTAVSEDASLMADASAQASKLADMAVRAIGRTRALLLSSFQTGLEEQMELEARAIADSGRDSESREGIAAFLAKRKPDFNPP
jgi:2-(1,2-epoxy-1,2-dihydrophenyl)acetyl-CoA isomerase